MLNKIKNLFKKKEEEQMQITRIDLGCTIISDKGDILAWGKTEKDAEEILKEQEEASGEKEFEEVEEI